MSFVSIKSKKTQNDEPKTQFDLNIPESEIQISNDAMDRIRFLKEKEKNKPQFLRVGIVGGGCSGLSYAYSFEQECRNNDLVFKKEDVAICVDPKSMKIIGGSLLHWQETMGRSGFQILNQEERKSCSCGESFSR